MVKLSNTAHRARHFVSAPVNGSNFRFVNSFGANSNQQRTTTSDVTDDPANNFDDVGYANGPVTTRRMVHRQQRRW